MKITVTSRYQLLDILQHTPYQSLISINDPGEDVPIGLNYLHTGSIKPLFFHDITEDIDGCIPPSEEIVQGIIDYSKKEFFEKNSTTMLIHCHAGISRSSSSAIIVAASVGLPIEGFIDTMFSERQVHPNYKMLEIAEDLLGIKMFFECSKASIQKNLCGYWFDGESNLDAKGRWYSGKKK